MIDAEKLLGKVLQTTMQSTKGKKYKKEEEKSDDLMGSLMGGLTSGKGLITAIGLGVGAYEILKHKSASAGQQQTTFGATASTTQHQTPPPPPPVPGQQMSQPGPPPPPPPTGQQPMTQTSGSSQELATRFIQTMVAAAHADGELDNLEEQRILERLQEGGVTSEEKMFILRELHAPKSIEQLVQGIADPSVAQTMYSLAVSTIIVDTAEERQWLDQLAEALSISKPMQKFIEEEM